jgi:hypothetical protein
MAPFVTVQELVIESMGGPDGTTSTPRKIRKVVTGLVRSRGEPCESRDGLGVRWGVGGRVWAAAACWGAGRSRGSTPCRRPSSGPPGVSGGRDTGRWVGRLWRRLTAVVPSRYFAMTSGHKCARPQAPDTPGTGLRVEREDFLPRAAVLGHACRICRLWRRGSHTRRPAAGRVRDRSFLAGRIAHTPLGRRRVSETPPPEPLRSSPVERSRSPSPWDRNIARRRSRTAGHVSNWWAHEVRPRPSTTDPPTLRRHTSVTALTPAASTNQRD